MTGVTVERTREVLTRYREELHSARIIAAHCYEQYESAADDESRAQRQIRSLLTTLAEHEPDVYAELSDAEREMNW